MKAFLKKNITIILLTFLIPGIISLLIKDSFSTYKSLVQPKFAPPGIVFPIVWNILYILMIISIIMVKDKDDNNIVIYYIQLLLNALWPVIFFKFNNYLLSLIELTVLFFIVLLMSIKFKKDNKISFYLLIPYLLWLIFAFYLNYNVYLLN